MLTSLKLALATAVMATGGFALREAFEPFDANLSPIRRVAGSGSKVAEQDPLAKKVTVQLEGSLSDIARWLSTQGINFVIPETRLDQRKLHLHVVDQPLKAVLDILAEALGGSWQRRGSVYIFQSKPSDPLARVHVLRRPDLWWPELDWSKLQDSEGRKLSDREMTKIQEAFEKAREAFRQALETMSKSGFRGIEAVPMKPLTESERKALEQSMKKLRDILGQGSDSKALGRIRAELRGIDRPGLAWEARNLARLVESLTPNQRELHKQQGFLTPADLTPEQRKLLPKPNGTWSLSYSDKGQSFTFKSGK